MAEICRALPRVLDRVVVTGNAIEAPARQLTVAMNVVTGAQLSRYAEGNLAQALSDAVPGLWVWQSAPTSLLAHYGSIRGTSSFGASYPKIYVDGIELANPLLVTQFTPETVDRIEIIRGPQGAAMYGTDAISGVINIVTRHDGSDNKASARAAIRGWRGLEHVRAAGSDHAGPRGHDPSGIERPIEQPELHVGRSGRIRSGRVRATRDGKRGIQNGALEIHSDRDGKGVRRASRPIPTARSSEIL